MSRMCTLPPMFGAQKQSETSAPAYNWRKAYASAEVWVSPPENAAEQPVEVEARDGASDFDRNAIFRQLTNGGDEDDS